MNKMKVNIINNTQNDTVHIALDYGEYQTVKANRVIRLLLRMILHPDKYEIEIAEY